MKRIKKQLCNKALCEYLDKLENKRQISTHLRLAYLFYSRYAIDNEFKVFVLSKEIKVLGNLRYVKRDILKKRINVQGIKKRLLQSFKLNMFVMDKDIIICFNEEFFYEKKD